MMVRLTTDAYRAEGTSRMCSNVEKEKYLRLLIQEVRSAIRMKRDREIGRRPIGDTRAARYGFQIPWFKRLSRTAP